MDFGARIGGAKAATKVVASPKKVAAKKAKKTANAKPTLATKPKPKPVGQSSRAARRMRPPRRRHTRSGEDALDAAAFGIVPTRARTAPTGKRRARARAAAESAG
jgi:hypothetical protein